LIAAAGASRLLASGDLVMMRRQLLNLKGLAEHTISQGGKYSVVR
jgi:hypothetical protein